jgi:hypothetical protein
MKRENYGSAWFKSFGWIVGHVVVSVTSLKVDWWKRGPNFFSLGSYPRSQGMNTKLLAVTRPEKPDEKVKNKLLYCRTFNRRGIVTSQSILYGRTRIA